MVALTAPALAQVRGTPVASPTMMPAIGQGSQGSAMQAVRMTTSGNDTMSTLQGMMDMRLATLMLKAADAESLMSGKQMTIFVPNDMAIQKTGADRIGMAMKDRQIATNMFKALMTEGTMMPTELTNGKSITMMNGQAMTVRMQDGQLMVDGARVVQAVRTSNGMIYVLDSMPSSVGTMQASATTSGKM